MEKSSYEKFAEERIKREMPKLKMLKESIERALTRCFVSDAEVIIMGEYCYRSQEHVQIKYLGSTSVIHYFEYFVDKDVSDDLVKTEFLMSGSYLPCDRRTCKKRVKKESILWRGAKTDIAILSLVELFVSTIRGKVERERKALENK